MSRPFAVTVWDPETGEEVTDLGNDPLIFTIRYAAEDLEAAGMNAYSPAYLDGEIAMYRYSDEGDFYEYIGGMNDLDAIKKKYGRSLILNGCSSPKDPYLFSWSTEEEVRQCMRDKIDRFAPDGGYICRGFVVAAKDDPTVEQRRNWVADEYLKYGRNWYQKH